MKNCSIPLLSKNDKLGILDILYLFGFRRCY